MKKIFIKICSAVICAIIIVTSLALITSCKKSDSSGDKAAGNENYRILVADGESDYVIIRPDKASKEMLDIMLGLHRSVQDKIGYSFNMATDWHKKGEEIDPDAKEILVGNTNRAETQEVIASLKPNSWAVVDKGNKIVICTNNEALLPLAIDWFVENCINVKEKTVAIEKNLLMTEDYGDKAILSVSGISGYQAVFPHGNQKLEYCASLLQRKACVDSVVSDKTAEITCEIIIGNTNRKEAVAFDDKNGYSITVEGSKIYINGANDSAIYYAVNDFLESGINYSEKIVSASNQSNKSGSLKNYFANGWDIALPYVEQGKISPVYNIGPGLANDNMKDSPSDSMAHLISNVEASAMSSYAKKLESFGFKKVYSAKTDKNELWGFKFGEAYAYVHYSPLQKAMRVIWDKSSNCSVSDFEYVQEQTGKTVFYQYSIDYTGASWQDKNNEIGANCGMLYFIKLQDNSLIMVDGGLTRQLSGETLKNLYEFLYKITGTDKKDPLKIRMWYVTHPDGDHNQGIVTILKYLDSRGPKPELERMIFNFPSERANSTVTKDAASYEMIDFINTNYPDVKYIKIHTGMVFNIGEVKVETLGTIENLFDANAKLNDEWDTNDTCVLLRFSFGGKSVMMEGDIGNDTNVQKFHIALYSKEFFKSDVLQIAHHGYNALTTLNSYCAPEYALVSNAASNMWDWYKNYWKNLVKDGKLHYAGDYTTAISVDKGQLSVKKLPR